MDFAKLVSLLSSQSLYLSRSDKFRDVFEGRIFGLKVLKERLEGRGFSGGNDFISAAFDEDMKERSELADFLREHVFINCWHLNEEQSAAMWDLYIKNGEGIAVQTTFGRLKQSLNYCKKDIYIGKVKYIDHKKEDNYFCDKISPFFTKRLSFKHEEEVRLVYSASDDREVHMNKPESHDVYGVNIEVDIFELTERIYISPDAPTWFKNVVEVILEKFNIDVEVIHSKLYELN
ncbi:hypothetical protein BWGOE13_18580 [Bacillus mycoides]|uniref:DUF2971 domain-containing protein n=1 Tax=Bacillus mycoides TaxID=1405 RepID=A0A1E8BQT1_BACMY|nr:DUF2971 domain-containing protein [Bacillus mycoides]OFD96859.1 hypothetical protein BWGOE11_18770 [Bacillus mycoides]OFE02365.1 hypothetical protein BWGOE13_18580 [Bacillus mycoides]